MQSSQGAGPSADDQRQIASAIDRLTRAVANDPRDARAWRELETWVARNGRSSEWVAVTRAVLRDALTRAPNDGATLHALAMVEAADGNGALAEDLLMRAAAACVESPQPDLLLARILEKKRDYDRAVAHYQSAVRRAPDHSRALLGLGSALYVAGRHAEASAAFQRVTELQPILPEAWGNLAVALAASGQETAALEPSARAAALAPTRAILHSNHGDALMANGEFAAAIDAYRRADERDADNAITLNKLSCALRAFGELDGPEQLLRRALSIEPDFGLALINLGTLETVRHRYAEARILLERGLLADIPDSARSDAREALTIVGEHQRLQPALVRAVEDKDPLALDRAVAETADAHVYVDAGYLARMEELAARLTTETQYGKADWPPLSALPSYWPSLEAHFAHHRGESLEEIRKSIPVAGHVDHASARFADDDRSREDFERFEEMVGGRQSSAYGPLATGAEWEARVRFCHAMLTWHRAECCPGQFKLLPNLTAAAPSHKFVPPRAVAGSLREFFTQILAAAPDGLPRAVLVLRALGGCHPFLDGNGRTARFFTNAELERADLHPVLIPARLRPRYVAAVASLRRSGDPAELLALMFDAARYTSQLIETLDDAA